MRKISIIILSLFVALNTAAISFQASQVEYTYYSNKKVRTKIETDGKGNYTDYIAYYSNGKKKSNYDYDKNGVVSKKVLYYANGSKKQVKLYYTNEKEKQISYYSKANKLTKVEKFNIKGKRTDTKQYSKGKVTVDYDYCTNGKVKAKKTYNSSGKKSTKSYPCKPVNLKIAQFNVLKPDDYTYGSWDARKAKIIKAIKVANPDIISLNEIYSNGQKQTISNNTKYTVIQPKGSQPYGWSSAIAYDKSKVKLIKSGSYFFKNQETYTTGSLAGKKASRTAVWGVFSKGGVKFVFISGQTQNDWNTNVRYKQITEMINLGQQLGKKYGTKNIIMAGDFNAHNYKNKTCTVPLPTYVGSSKKLSYDYICSTTGTTDNGTVVNSNGSDHALVYTSTRLQ